MIPAVVGDRVHPLKSFNRTLSIALSCDVALCDIVGLAERIDAHDNTQDAPHFAPMRALAVRCSRSFVLSPDLVALNAAFNDPPC